MLTSALLMRMTTHTMDARMYCMLRKKYGNEPKTRTLTKLIRQFEPRMVSCMLSMLFGIKKSRTVS